MLDSATGGSMEASRFSGMVAVVDDDSSVRRALARLLRAHEIPCVTHHSGVEFLASPVLHEVDCLLLDVHMPELSGIEQLDAVRVAVSKLPIILMSGRYDADFAERAAKVGVSGMLQKPFTEEELLDALEATVGHATS